MKVFVLSLPDSHARRKSALSKLLERKLDFQIVDGVEATKMRPETLPSTPHARTWMKPTELACYAAHLRGLRRIVDLRLPYGCILEDDFCFEPHPEVGLEHIESHLPSSFHYIHLQTNLFINAKYRSFDPDGLFRRVCETPYCGTGYIVSRSLAEYILMKHLVCHTPIDHLYAELSYNGHFYEAISPLIGVQADLPSDTHL